jgi:DMSO/TMAO reductase YedYZ molybdopterin-dependent catalytic subunit
MRHPWVNTLLLGFVAVALATGYLGLTEGDPGRAWILALHGIAAYAILAVLAWKAAVVIRSLRRHRVLGTPRMVFVLMAALFLFVLGSGLIWANAGRIVFGRVSLIELHQWAAALVAALLAWHVLARRRVFGVPYSRDRRAFLRLAAGSAVGLVLWQGGATLARIAALPGSRRRFTGSYERGSFTGRFPAVSWLFDDPNRIDPAAWTLSIDGAVATPVELRLADLRALPTQHLEATLDCTGGWYTVQRWSGVPLATLLDLASPADAAASIEVRSVTGFSRRFSLAEATTTLLALGVADAPLSHGHGAPARLVVPDHRAFDWVKWVDRITVHTTGDHWQTPLPL